MIAKLPPRNRWPIPGIRPPWGELGRWGKVRRVVYWVSMVGNVGLIISAETSGSDLHLKADGTKRSPRDEPNVERAQPQRDQADEQPAQDKREQPEQHEGNAADASV